jgi:hypothetical protein
MNEGGLDFVVPERMAHLSEVVSILLMELESLKIEEKSATVTRDESVQKVRGVELVLQSFEAFSSSSKTLRDDAKKDVIFYMLRERTKLVCEPRAGSGERGAGKKRAGSRDCCKKSEN